MNVQLKEFSTLGDAKRAFERGQADILPGTLSELLLLAARPKQDTVAFFITDYSNGGDVIVAHKSISNVNKLKGKKIGVDIGSPGPYLLHRALGMNKLSFKDVAPIHQSLVHMDEELAYRKIEAMASYPPFSTAILKNPDYKIIFSSREIPGEIVDVLMAHRELLKNRRNEIVSLLMAYKKAQEYAKDHPDESYAIMARRENISVEDFKKSVEQDIMMVSYEQQSSYLQNGGTLLKILKGIERVMRETGQLTTPVLIERLIYHDLLPR